MSNYIKERLKKRSDDKAKLEVEQPKEETTSEVVGGLIENLSNVEVGKKWWQSKTIWVNIVAIIGSLGAVFGLNIPLDPELCMTLFPIVLGVINMILRGVTKAPLKTVKKA